MTDRGLLRVTAPHFVAGAVWERVEGYEWRCTEAAPIIRWMVGKRSTDVRRYLNRKPGWSYTYRRLHEGPSRHE